MKNLDRISQIVLVCIILFFGWIAFQWSPQHIKPKSAKKGVSAEVSKSEPVLPKRKNGNYISRYFGAVTINGSSKMPDSVLNSASFTLTSVTTKKNEWLSYEFENGGYILIFPNSKLSRGGKTTNLIEGKFFVNGLGFDQVLLAKTLKINTSKEAAILVESRKVRVFALGEEITIPAFGKKEIIQKGQGISFFLNNKNSSKYELSSAVSPKNVDTKTLNWAANNEAKSYLLITESEQTEHNEIKHVVSLEVLGVKQRSASIPSGMKKAYVFSENRHGSWSQN